MIKWTLRLLFVIICMIGAALLMLNILSGTGESQKKGLEGAFSQVFQGQAHIGALKTFNILPQFDVDAADITIDLKNNTTIKAEQVRIAFAFVDLFKGNHHIEALNLKNIDIGKDILGPFPVKIGTASIQQKNGENGELVVDGVLDAQKLHLTLDLQSFPTPRPSYALRESNPFQIDLGTVKTSGHLVPYKPDYKAFTNVTVEAFGKVCAFGEDSAITGDVFFADVLMAQTHLKNAKDFMKYCTTITKPVAP